MARALRMPVVARLQVVDRRLSLSISREAGGRDAKPSMLLIGILPCLTDIDRIEIVSGVENGRVLAYLAQHTRINGLTYEDEKVLLICRMPRRCLDFLAENGAAVRSNGARLFAGL
jgi:hypothetical protein